MTTTLECPACGVDQISVQWKAFVTQGVRLLEDGSLDYDTWESEDVDYTDYTDDKGWYVCRSCGEHSESIDHFKTNKEAAC